MPRIYASWKSRVLSEDVGGFPTFACLLCVFGICKCIYTDKCHREARGLPILARRVYVCSMHSFVNQDTYTNIMKV